MTCARLFPSKTKMAAKCTSEKKVLTVIVNKLGLSDEASKVLKKSEELLRLLQLKVCSGKAGLVQLNDTCRSVICVDLAASLLDVPFKKEDAVILAGVNKRVYRNCHHIVQKLLGLYKTPTISELSIQLGCTEVSDLTQAILQRYVSDREKGLIKCPPIDLTHPMYTCAAILAACRFRRCKVKKEILIEMCCVKAADLEKLAAEFLKVAPEVDTKQKCSRKRTHNLVDLIASMVKESQKESISAAKQDRDYNEESGESYDAWKKRILQEANVNNRS